MATARAPDDVERDLLNILGEDAEVEEHNSQPQLHEEELTSLLNLLEGNSNEENINSDEDFDDVGGDTISDRVDMEGSSSSSDEEDGQGPSGSTAIPVEGNDGWNLQRPRSVPVRVPQFSSSEELRIPEGTSDPIDYFKLFFNQEFLSNVVRWTNMCASTLIAEARLENRNVSWKPLEVPEFLIFLGILFHMGSIKLNRYSDYWRGHYLYNLFAGQFMSRSRFLAIFRCLRFGENNLTSLINYFNKKMLEIYTPGENLCLDESLILSRGRSGIRQYIKGKRHKYGIKLYVLATPGGLVLQTHMYRGKNDVEVGGQGHTDKVVAKLLQSFMQKGRHVYMDNFYNSVGLATFLMRNKTNLTGTLRSRRKSNPKVVCNKKLGKGGSIYRFDKNSICVSKWKDKRDVLSISTKLSPELIPYTNRRGQIILKPEIIIEYNKYMSGVDRQDQMLAYYTCEHKTMRWYKKVGIHIFQMMMLNAYFLYLTKPACNISLYKFREVVITSLLPPPNNGRGNVQNREVNNNIRVHLPAALDKNEQGKTKRKRCKHCWDTRNIRRNTLFCCPDCYNKPGLCLECFRTFHNY